MTKWVISTQQQQDAFNLLPPESNTEVEGAPCITRELSPSAIHDQHYKIEQNGLHAVAIICLNGTSVCTDHSTILFPTRITDRNNPRGYLQTPLQLPKLPSPPTLVTFDGITLSISRPPIDPSDHLGFKFSIFVSPESPVIHTLLQYNTLSLVPSSAKTSSAPTGTIVTRNGGYNVIRVTHWRNHGKMLHTAFSCLPIQQTPSPLLDLRLRWKFVNNWTSGIVLKCPDNYLNSLVHFAKIRTSEAVFDSPTIGLCHSPGGNMFYCGVWCNDQVEYTAPLTPYLYPPNATEHSAIRQSLRTLYEHFDIHSKQIPYSVEIDGGYIGRLDRGDAAMFAFGTSQYLLCTRNFHNSDNDSFVNEMKQAIQFACEILIDKIEDCAEGVVASQSDELEGRFPTGDFNLSTNTLAICALFSTAQFLLSTTYIKSNLINPNSKQCAIDTAKALKYQDIARKLRSNVHEYFKTGSPWRYDYFKECTVARGWCCLSSLAGLPDSRNAIRYCLTSLWTPDGVRVSSDSQDVWDRCTLYTIALGFQSSLVELSLDRFIQYARARMVHGVAAPYAVECQGSWAQLSAESALVLRVVINGMLGLRPLADGTFVLKPVCPTAWPSFKVEGVWLGGFMHSFEIIRESRGSSCMYTVNIKTSEGQTGISIAEGTTVVIRLGDNHESPISIDIMDMEWLQRIS